MMSNELGSGWDAVRRWCVAIDVDADTIIDRAQRNGISAGEILRRFERAATLRWMLPPTLEFPLEVFRATPPGKMDIRILYQEGHPRWWVDILGTVFAIEDREAFTGEHLNAVLDHLRARAPALYSTALNAYPRLPHGQDPHEWIERTPLWGALINERLRRASGTQPQAEPPNRLPPAAQSIADAFRQDEDAGALGQEFLSAFEPDDSWIEARALASDPEDIAEQQSILRAVDRLREPPGGEDITFELSPEQIAGVLEAIAKIEGGGPIHSVEEVQEMLAKMRKSRPRDDD